MARGPWKAAQETKGMKPATRGSRRRKTETKNNTTGLYGRYYKHLCHHIGGQARLSVCLLQQIRASVVLLQEVAVPAFNFKGFQEVVNAGEQRRGTAILVRNSLPMSAPVLLPCGRALSVRVGDTRVLCVYAPSGSRQTSGREEFFARDLTPLLADAGERIIVGGDWNCVVRGRMDSTGQTPESKQLPTLLSAMGLKDAWTSLRAEPGHTFHAGPMSARLDRVYVTGNMLPDLAAASTSAVACSADHLALVVTLHAQRGEQRSERHGPARTKGRGGKSQTQTWSMDSRILRDPHFEALLAARWPSLRAKQNRYPSLIDWWIECAKPGIRA